jgi:DNA polymerase-3 subunit beta
MKIKLSRQAVQRAWASVAPVVPAKGPKEVLRNVLLTADASGVSLQATDLEIGALAAIEAEFNQPGKVLLPTRFGSIISEATGDIVTLEVDDRQVQIAAGAGVFKLPTGNPDEFPAHGVRPEPQVEVESDSLVRGIGATVWAVDTDNSRFALGGVMFEQSTDGMRMIGTDGRRLSFATIGGTIAAWTSVVVPARALNLARKVTGTVYMGTDGNRWWASADGFAVWCSVIEGRFPKWESIVPQASDPVTVGRESFLHLVKQAAICSDQESRGIDLTFRDGSIEAAARAADIGSARASIPYEGGDRPSLTVDSRYLIQWLAGVDAERVEVFVRSAKEALMLQAGSCRYVVMPMERG